jgi:hypothetical protein
LKRNIVSIQFTENGLIILNKKELKEYLLKSVNNYKVINKELFKEEITNIIEKNNINKNILTDNLNIIIDNTYSDIYLLTLKDIMKELSFNKIEFINILDLVHLKNNEILIDISINSIKFISKTKTIKNNIYYQRHKSILNIYLKQIIKEQRLDTIFLYGNYPFTTKIIDNIEKISNCKVYIYSQPKSIPLKLLI